MTLTAGTRLSSYEIDHEADWREWENRVKLIADTLETVEGVQTEMFAPPLH